MISKMLLLLGLCLVTLGSPIDEANLEDDLDETNLEMEIEDALDEAHLDLEDSDTLRGRARMGLEDSDRQSFRKRCKDCKTNGYGSLRWCSAKMKICEKMLAMG